MQQRAPERVEVAGEKAVDDVQTRPRGRRRDKGVDASTAGEPPQLVVAEADDDESEPEDRDRSPGQ